MARDVPRIRTFRGVAVPAFFYGTAWKEERTEELTKLALSAGFQAIDTANQRRHYVESAVGDAIEERLDDGSVTRADLFLQTKFTYARGQDHRIPYDPRADLAEQVAQSFASSLVHLRTDYVDSYLLHGPSSSTGFEKADVLVWRAMESLHDAGKARLIGVSNVSAAQLATLLSEARVPPAFVQNRCFAHSGWDRDVRSLCDANGVLYQAFSLLTANPREREKPAVRAIARRLGTSVPKLLFRFALELGMIPLTGTSSFTHMREDLEAFDLALDDADRDSLERATSL